MEPLGLLAGMEDGAAGWKTGGAPQKVQHRTALRPCFSASGHLARELKTNGSLYQNVHSSMTPDSQRWKRPMCISRRWTAKRTHRQGHRTQL